MKFLLKIVLDIFGNKASIIFALAVVIPALGTAIWKYNQWLDARESKTIALEQAKQTKQELARAGEAIKIYYTELGKLMDNRVKDEEAIAELKTFSETQGVLINETLKELGKAGGSWATSAVPSNRQRVLALTLSELESSTYLSADSEGASPGRTTPRVSGDFLRKLKEVAVERTGDRE